MTMCERCLWIGNCLSEEACRFYSPYEEDIDQMIEGGRAEFRRQWSIYTKPELASEKFEIRR